AVQGHDELPGRFGQAYLIPFGQGALPEGVVQVPDQALHHGRPFGHGVLPDCVIAVSSPCHRRVVTTCWASISWLISLLPSMISMSFASRYARSTTCPSSAPAEPMTWTAAAAPRAAPRALTYLASTVAITTSADPASQQRLACSHARIAACSSQYSSARCCATS